MDGNLMRRVVPLAHRAPSAYGSRPWRWLETPDGLDLYADPRRQLAALDPTGRLMVTSCGTALGFARIAVRSLDLDCRNDLLPGDDVDHLARIVVLGKRPADQDDLALAAAIGRRPGVRDRFSPSALRARLEANVEGGWLQWLDSEADRVRLAALADRADRIERADPAIRAELVRWLRDGATDVPARRFQPHDPTPTPGQSRHLPPSAQRAEVALIGTRYDGPVSWLQVGQATARIVLRAAAVGVVASPLAQVLDVAWTRQRLRAALGLVGHPQMLLRLDCAVPDGQRTPPRSARDVLRVPTGRPAP